MTYTDKQPIIFTSIYTTNLFTSLKPPTHVFLGWCEKARGNLEEHMGSMRRISQLSGMTIKPTANCHEAQILIV